MFEGGVKIMLYKREGLKQVAFFDGLEKKLQRKARPRWPRGGTPTAYTSLTMRVLCKARIIYTKKPQAS